MLPHICHAYVHQQEGHDDIHLYMFRGGNVFLVCDLVTVIFAVILRSF